jgi:hypothetical protein
MTDDQQRPRSSLAVWLIVGAVLLPVLYVLSSGPVISLCKYGYLAKECLVIYIPLAYLGQNYSIVRQSLQAYFDLWGV